MKTRYYSILAGLAASLFLSNCSNSPLSPSDTQNDNSTLTVKSMGDAAFASLDESSLAAEMLAIESPAPESILTLPALPQATATSPASLGKKAAGAPFSIDTVDGKLRLTTAVTGSDFEKRDTVEVLLDETVYDGIDGNESITSLRGATFFSNGASEHYIVEDIDGDHVINRGDQAVRARLTLISIHGEITATTIFEADAGTDGNFDTGSDNDLLQVSWVKMNGNDTAASALFTDADGDGVITASKAGSVNIVLYDAEKPLHPLVASNTVRFTIERPENEAERVNRFYAEKRYITGRVSKATVTDESGDETFDAGETVVVTIGTTAPASADTEATAEMVCTIDPGYSLGNESDNSLISLTLKKEYHYGLRNTSEFSCTFTPPVLSGEEPEGGEFLLTVNYKNGQTATLAGTFTRDSISAEHTNVNGEKAEVQLSRED